MASRPVETTVAPDITATPDTTIALDDLVAKAKEEGCVVLTGKESFIGEPGTTTGLGYPHLHVWNDGSIALSVSKGRNTKVGKDGVISISLLSDAASRFGLPAGRLRNTIGWVLASAS